MKPRLFYFPHYGVASPYQAVVNAALPGLDCRPGNIDEALGHLELDGNVQPVVMALYWLGPVLAGAGTEAEAELLRVEFRDTLARFVDLGGIVVWALQPGELAAGGARFADVLERVQRDVADLATRVLVRSRRVVAEHLERLEIGAEKLLVRTFGPQPTGPDLGKEILAGYRFRHVEIDFETGPLTCRLAGRPFPPARTARTAVIILNYQNIDDTRRLIRALRKSTDLDFDLYVVDNATPGLTDYRAAVRFPGAHVLRLPANLGYAAGNNAAMRLIRNLDYEFLWILNPDMEVLPQTLAQHVEAARKHPRFSVFGPAICDDATLSRVASAGMHVAFGETFSIGHMFVEQPVSDLPQEPYGVDALTGASLFLRKNVLKDAGYMPEDYFLYFEETDWLLKARRHGHPCMVLPHVRAVHHQRSDDNGVPTNYGLYYYLRNAFLFCGRMGYRDAGATEATLYAGSIDYWLGQVERHAPAKLDAYRALVDRALADGKAGVSGRIALPDL